MATRKYTKRSAKNGKSGNGAAPGGFRKVDTHLGGFWKPEIAGQSIQGIVGEAIEVQGVDGKLNTFYSLTLTTNDGGPVVGKDGKKIEIGEGMMIGIGGKMLLIFLRGREGKEVYLTYTGLGVKKPGQSAPKLFDTFERAEED